MSWTMPRPSMTWKMPRCTMRFGGKRVISSPSNQTPPRVISPSSTGNRPEIEMVHAEARSRAGGGDGERRGSRTGLLPA
jgi:hypothetical protein